jgi:hypothetical protein
MCHDPAFTMRQLDQVLLARQHSVIVSGHLCFVREEPLELEAAARTAVPLALPDNDRRAALRTAEVDGGETLL